MALIEEEEEEGPLSKFATADDQSDGYETASDGELNDAVSEPHSNHSRDSSSSLSISNNESNKNDSGVNNEDRVVNEEEKQLNPEAKDSESREKALAEANDLKLEGNSLFKDGSYEEALSKYELAIKTAADGDSSAEVRSICYANRAACFSKQGKYEETIKECTKALELNPAYLKVLLRRAEAREKLEQYEESIADMNRVLELDPSNDQARRAIPRLKPLADEKREKMKEEMIGKLKEMGNSILGHFGMSIDNFKAVKDPNTGSYSLSFQN